MSDWKNFCESCLEKDKRIEVLEAELIEAKCCLVQRERYHKAKLKQTTKKE